MIILSPINSFKSLSLSIIIITTQILLQNNIITSVRAQEHTPKLGYSVKERVSLVALKSSLNDPFLNKAWIGPHCDANVSKWFGVRCDSEGYVTEIALESMGLNATIGANAFTSFAEFSVLRLANNSLGGTLIDFGSNHKLTRVDLSRNLFSGPIPVSLVGLPSLESVLLQDNSFSGSIPEFDNPRMREFNVSNNNDLSGPIPRTRVLQSFDFESYKGNPNLCGPPSPTACEADSPQPQTGSISDEKTSHRPSLFSSIKRYLLVLDFALLLVVVLLFIWYFKKAKNLKKKKISMMRDYAENRKDQPERSQPDNIDQDHDEKITNITDIEKENDHHSHRRSSSSSAMVISNNNNNKLIFFDDNDGNSNFELSDLLKASAELLGQYYGTFGNSYKVMIEGKETVVVKRLRNLRPLTDEEFEKQLRIIGEQRHPNLLPIIAYCNGKDDNKLLVYKYVERGNLFDRIHGKCGGVKGGNPPFRWPSRLTVATGIARALSHLHRNLPPTFLPPHGNLKPTNVLLGPNDTPLLSDFALSSLVSVRPSPESRKSDVWSFGCLLLELLTGKASADDLPRWVHKAVREEWTAEIFDREIFSGRRSAVPGALRLLEIAMRCVERSPEKRPEMEAVARMVEEIHEQSDESSFDRSSFTDDSISGDHDRVSNK